ncbi:general amino acid permease AGP2 [Ceratobasidium sp. AG-Ba]|nr:general amino acid permease AGP2 [Ceratobasidium sp. AG-Ba]
MAEQVIDLTLSDDNKSQQNGSNGAGVSAESGRRARRNRGSRNRQKSASENGGAEAVGSSQKHEASSSKESRHQLKSDKGGDPNQEPTRPNRSSNVASSLLSRIGDILHENEKENKSRRDRAPREGKERGRAISGGEPQTSSSKRSGRRSRSRSPKAPKEVALSELPVDQLFFIDTSPTTQGKEPGSEISTPLGAGASVPNEANVVSARALKHKQSKEHKKEQNLEAPVQVQGDVVGNDAAPEVEFIGDSTRVEILKQTPDGTAVAATLALPPHVTLWTEGDPDVSLADVAAGGLDLEDGVEYIDFEDDQAAGVARYFLPDAAAATKKLCRTCGEEGHIAKNCKKLICLTCGERDDHDTRNCPMRVVCFNCGGKGHVVSVCSSMQLLAKIDLGGARRVLNRAGNMDAIAVVSYTHIHQRCLDQFKTYIYLSDSERLKILEERAKLENLPFGEGGEGYIARHIWCYNCGGPGHWGDQHNAPKDPCAFSSHNASRGPFGDISDEYVRARDAPRPAWMDDDPHLQGVGRRGKEASMKRNRAAEASRAADERDDDDWFSRKAVCTRIKQLGSGDKLPPKPKISFQFRDNEGRTSSDGRDRIRERHRDRGRNRDQIEIVTSVSEVVITRIKSEITGVGRMMAKNPIEGVSLETMTEGLGVHL